MILSTCTGYFCAGPNLESLNVRGTHVGDEGAQAISRLLHMKDLDLGSCQITDQGLMALKGKVSFESVCLDHDEAISDRSLPTIKSWRGLRRLELAGTSLSEAADRDIVAAFPSLKIVR